MKLSTRGRYAIQLMIVIARQSADQRPVNLAQVSRQTSISRRYLEQVAIHMKNAGLLRAMCGRHGGYLLSRPAEEITAHQIIEAAIGKINIVDCVTHPESCVMVDDCECRCVFMMVNHRIRDALQSFTLAELAERQPDVEEIQPALA